MSFDAFGQRRNALDWSDGFPSDTELRQIREITTNGYTGHHMVDAAKLIHMGGRIYDPALGRFLSPDPHIPAPFVTQSYNRYSYVRNNPLSFIDPSGFMGQQTNDKSCAQDQNQCTREQQREIKTCQKKNGPFGCAMTDDGEVVPVSSLSSEVQQALGDAGPNNTVSVATGDDGTVEAAWFVEDNKNDKVDTRNGIHAYTAGPNKVCGRDECTPDEMADYLSRFTVPGQDPNVPVEDGSKNWVYDPRFGFPAGKVLTSVSMDGLTVKNRTLSVHVFFDGMITRNAINIGGTWYVVTQGIGFNVVPGAAYLNQTQGPAIFDYLDQQMQSYINSQQGGGW